MMDLEQWQAKVSKHLQFIEAGSSMAARHASLLPVKPGFETMAEDDLVKARKALEAALQNIIAAQSIYANKPVEHAA